MNYSRMSPFPHSSFVENGDSIIARVRRSRPIPSPTFGYSSAWEVVELCSLNGIPHVRIVRVSDPNELKLISVSAFLERYEFTLE